MTIGTLTVTPIELIATVLFALAVLHTFLTRFFEHLAHINPAHAGLWHLLGEVEVVFGFWAFVLILFFTAYGGIGATVEYLEDLDFTEPAFVFVIMTIASGRPVLASVAEALRLIARVLPFRQEIAFYAILLSVGPLMGSLITEPAAMTICALLLRDRYFGPGASGRFMYGTLAVLFVNISIGGVLTAYAAPPVLMVADKWSWTSAYMFATFGWKAAVAVVVNAAVVAYLFRRELCDSVPGVRVETRPQTPWALTALHFVFLAAVVALSHYPTAFLGLFLLFLGLAEAYKRHLDPPILREGLMVGFFLAGLVVLGGPQQWWLNPVLVGADDTALFFGALALTPITDNAALTYLGSLVEDASEGFRYALVAGAVAAGGLTVIANAPNPAGFSILKGSFPEGAISPLYLFLAALAPTAVAVLAFQLPRLLF